ncbi:MAG: MATE family efflux transporter [Acidimicrobiia bacterium]|nr:MAG: MATE family efflux transporter [Acidimicrobiia bacterium]
MDPRDREILRLAVPAFGALVAEPLYVLVDTAIVGRLGTLPLGGLAVAGAVLTAGFGVFNFLAYGTTAAVARRIGARDDRAAAEHGIAGLWLALALGVALTILGLLLAPWIVDAMGASERVRPYALTYLRIGLLGAAPLLCTLAATGYVRGLQDTSTPLAIALGSNLLNLLLDLVLIYGFDLGIAGSAWATVLAQTTAAVAFLVVVSRRARAAHASPRPVLAYVRNALVVGGQLTVRTAALLAVFTTTTAIASRIGDDEVAAHQIAWQIWLFLALALDAIAIAGQAIVGRTLGAADAGGTRASARRMIEWAVIAGGVAAAVVIAARPFLASAFTDDPAVRDHLLVVLWAVAVMQPLGAVVFVLDGILIGAGESRYLAVAMLAAAAAFVPAAALVLTMGGGLLALWGALYVFMFARLYGMLARFRGDAWLVVGATRS